MARAQAWFRHIRGTTRRGGHPAQSTYAAPVLAPRADFGAGGFACRDFCLWLLVLLGHKLLAVLWGGPPLDPLFANEINLIRLPASRPRGWLGTSIGVKIWASDHKLLETQSAPRWAGFDQSSFSRSADWPVNSPTIYADRLGRKSMRHWALLPAGSRLPTTLVLACPPSAGTSAGAAD